MKRFVFILSPSYSGSTLLTLLLARHPRIATVGELKATAMGDIEQYRCSCDEAILRCAFWAELKARLAARGLPFDLRDFDTNYRRRGAALLDLALRMPVQTAMGETARRLLLALAPRGRQTVQHLNSRNLAFAQAVCDIQGGDVFLDGSKEPQRFLMLLQAGVPAPRVIHIVRDGRAATNSALGHEYSDLRVAARDWRHTHAQAMRIQRILPPDAFTSIRYEDLCAQPEASLDRLFRFIDLDPAQARRDDPPPHHVLGNSMRLRQLTEIRTDERWRQQMTHDQLVAFEKIGGPMNRRFGYG